MEGVRSVQPSIMDGPAVDTLQPAQVPEVEDGGEGHRAEVHAWNSTVRGAGVVNAGSGGGASLRRRVTGPLPREVGIPVGGGTGRVRPGTDRKSTRLNSSHSQISYAVFCLKKKKNTHHTI